MIIGLDLDNTITDFPELFSLLSRALVAEGHEVHVITFREPGTEAEVAEELAELGIRYTGLHVPSGIVRSPQWKADVARRLGLDLMVEDSPEVLAAMPPGTQRLWLCDPEVFDLETCVRALHRELE